MFLFFELIIFMTMYVWYYSRLIRNRFLKFVELGRYSQLLNALSNDNSVPKFATHLVYLTKANNRTDIEEKVINSIFAKKPKRADVYWFVHLNRTEHPYTLDYEINELVEDKVIKVNINIGFRIPPRTELYFKRITQELMANKELNLHLKSDGSNQYNSEPDFKFVVIEKFLSVENEFTLREGLLLNTYFFLRRLGLKDEKAFGLDKSDVEIEYVPLIYHRAENIGLTRKQLA